MKKISTFMFLVVALFGARQANAIPLLQLYVEGGTYNTVTESWEITPSGSSGGAPFIIWAIGNTAGSGNKGTISDVKLSIAYDKADVGLSISITPTKIGSGSGSFNGMIDVNASIAPIQNTVNGAVIGTSNGNFTVGSDEVVDNASSPLKSDGSALPAHGIFGTGVVWEQYGLGDFSETGDSIGDFINNFPSGSGIEIGAGQINAYSISVTGGSGATLHFDLFDSVESKNHTKVTFAPFSHDGDVDTNIVPEPASICMWAVFGLFGVAGVALRKRKTSAYTSS